MVLRRVVPYGQSEGDSGVVSVDGRWRAAAQHGRDALSLQTRLRHEGSPTPLYEPGQTLPMAPQLSADEMTETQVFCAVAT